MQREGARFQTRKAWAYWFDIDPDPLTGKRRQKTESGFKTEKAAWKACRDAIKDYESGQTVTATRHKVRPALDEWLTRIEHSIKPSMAQNWRNYAKYYVVPYIGERYVQDIDGGVCDVLYAKLLAEGRVKAKSKPAPTERPVHVRRSPKAARSSRADRTDMTRCAATGRTPKMTRCSANRSSLLSLFGTARGETSTDGAGPSGTSSSTRTLRASPARAVPSGQSVSYRPSCNALGKIASSPCGCSKRPRACGAANWRVLAGSCSTSTPERSPSARRASSSTARSSNRKGRRKTQHLLALDPFTLAVLKTHVETLDQERKDLGPDYHNGGWLFCWENGKPPHPDTITRRFKRLAKQAGLPEIDLHDVRHSYATAGRNAKIDWKALPTRIGHADVAFTMKQYVQTDLEADREVANTLADLIIGGLLVTEDKTTDDQADEHGDSDEAG